MKNDYKELISEKQQRLINQLTDKDIWVAYSLPEDKVSKWMRSNIADYPIDLRNVLQNEVVFDLDFKQWRYVSKYGNKIVRELNKRGLPFKKVFTGGKGAHISVFYNVSVEQIALIKVAGLKLKDVRGYIWNDILDSISIPKQMRGKGEPFDSVNINFGERTKGRIVMMIGGRKYKNGSLAGYCTLLDNGFPYIKPRIYDPEDIVFPEKVELAPLDGLDVIIKSISDDKKRNGYKYNGKAIFGNYLQLPCIKRILRGMPYSKRNFGDKILAVGCRLSGKNLEQGLEVERIYESRCDGGDGGDFKTWMRWIYQKSSVYWSCSEAFEIGVCSPDCKYNVSTMKKEA